MHIIVKKNKSSKIHRMILINDKKEKEIKKNYFKKNTNKILYTSSSSINGFNQNQFMKETFLLFHSFGR